MNMPKKNLCERDPRSGSCFPRRERNALCSQFSATRSEGTALNDQLVLVMPQNLVMNTASFIALSLYVQKFVDTHISSDT